MFVFVTGDAAATAEEAELTAGSRYWRDVDVGWE
jgi:hypothetical protein